MTLGERGERYWVKCLLHLCVSLLLPFWEQCSGPGFAGQASSAGFVDEICSGAINLLPVKQRNAAFSLNYRSEYGATGTN